MMNTPKSRWIAASALVAVLVAAGATVAAAGGREGGRRHRGHRRAHDARTARDGRAGHAKRALERIDSLTDDQARTALAAATDLGRIREEVRGKKAAMLLQAFRDAKAAPERKDAIREATRTRMKALREEMRVPFTEAGMKVVRSLTPDQRAKIEEAAKKRGKTVTDESLARRFGMRLSRPWAEALLKARLENAPTIPTNK